MSNDLDSDLAAISVVKSAELLEVAQSSRDLNLITNEVLGSANKVEAIKDLLLNKQPHELSPEDAIEIDGQLSELRVITTDGSDVEFNATRVEGAEAFGLTLRPSVFIASRVAACEGFLDNVVESTKTFTKTIAAKFQEAYTLVTEDAESLVERFRLIDTATKQLKQFPQGLERFNLSARLYNLLKVNGEVKEDWYNQILNLYKTTTALTINYYDYSEKELTQIMSVFSGFEGLQTDDQVIAQLMKTSVILNNPGFKECKVDISPRNVPWLRVMRSVNLMGDRHLVDTRWKTPLKVDSTKAIDDWFDSRITDIGVRLNKRETADFLDIEQEIDTLSSDTIKHVSQLSVKLLESWLQVCQKANKHRINDRDYEEIGDNILKLECDPVLKQRVLAMYSMLVRKNQQDLLNITSDFTRYLVLTLNAVAGLCNDTINFVKEGKNE